MDREAGLLWAAVDVERKVPFPFPGCLRESKEMLSSSSSSSPASVGGFRVVAWPRVPVPGSCRAAFTFVKDSYPDPISACYRSIKLVIGRAERDGLLTRGLGDWACSKLIDGSWWVGVLLGVL
jgi:hypothetical protein